MRYLGCSVWVLCMREGGREGGYNWYWDSWGWWMILLATLTERDGSPSHTRLGWWRVRLSDTLQTTESSSEQCSQSVQAVVEQEISKYAASSHHQPPRAALLTPDISAVSRAGAGLVATGNTGYVCFNRPAEVRCPIRWEDLLNLLFGGSHSTVVALSRHLIGWLSADQPMRREPGGGIFPNLEVCTNEQNLVCCARQALQCSNSNPAFLLLLCAGPDEPAGPGWHQPRGQNMTNLILGSVIGITACLHPASLIYNIAQ